MGPVDASLGAFPSRMFGRLISQLQVLKAVVPDVGFKLSAPQGKAQEYELLHKWFATLEVGSTARLPLSLSLLLQCFFPLFTQFVGVS